MTGSDRDRDREGRARQARPRDALGRPLPYGAQGVEPVSEQPLPPEETLRAAREFVQVGRAFAAGHQADGRQGARNRPTPTHLAVVTWIERTYPRRRRQARESRMNSSNTRVLHQTATTA